MVGHLDCGFAGQLADHFAGADVAYRHNRYRYTFVDRKPGQGWAEHLNLEGGGAVRGDDHFGPLCRPAFLCWLMPWVEATASSVCRASDLGVEKKALHLVDAVRHFNHHLVGDLAHHLTGDRVAHGHDGPAQAFVHAKAEPGL